MQTNAELFDFQKVASYSKRDGYTKFDTTLSAIINQVENIKILADSLPNLVAHNHFPLNDQYEFWGLDHDNEPVALIASTYQQRFITTANHSLWQASPASDIGFPSQALDDDPASHHPRYYAEVLENKVNRRISCRRWIRRLEDGSGQLICNAFTAITERRQWSAQCFPMFGVSPDPDDPITLNLYLDWVKWTAPMLLTLSSLNDITRGELETQACQRAIQVDRLFRLYPKIIHPSLIDRARVESRMRLAV
ncbi:MAG: hypothetical protein ACI9FD_004575 [Gammaproteobacteria bacterium]|jgi:hypothetical protein